MSRRGKTRWEPAAMPWIADALGAAESIYQSYVDKMPPDFSMHSSRPYMRKFAERVGSADLFWLSRTAAAVAADFAAHGMPEVTFQELIVTSRLPPVGLMLWPKSLASLPWTNHRVQDPDAPPMTVTWDGIAWIYDAAEFTVYLLSQVAGPRSAGALSDVRPAWSPGQVVRLDSKPLDSGPASGETRVPIIEPPDEFGVDPTVSQVVAAVLALIGQERVVTARTMVGQPSRSTQTVDRIPTISLIDVLRPPSGHGSGRRGGEHERAVRRWFVRGHWRRQRHGPGGAQRKLIYIELHTAGHPDAPEPTGEVPRPVHAIYASNVAPPGGGAPTAATPPDDER